MFQVNVLITSFLKQLNSDPKLVATYSEKILTFIIPKWFLEDAIFGLGGIHLQISLFFASSSVLHFSAIAIFGSFSLTTSDFNSDFFWQFDYFAKLVFSLLNKWRQFPLQLTSLMFVTFVYTVNMLKIISCTLQPN